MFLQSKMQKNTWVFEHRQASMVKNPSVFSHPKNALCQKCQKPEGFSHFLARAAGEYWVRFRLDEMHIDSQSDR